MKDRICPLCFIRDMNKKIGFVKNIIKNSTAIKNKIGWL